MMGYYQFTFLTDFITSKMRDKKMFFVCLFTVMSQTWEPILVRLAFHLGATSFRAPGGKDFKQKPQLSSPSFATIISFTNHGS